MVRRLNSFYKIFPPTLCVFSALLLAIPSQAQFLKKKSSAPEKDSEYAYQTFSTTVRKEKKQGYAGSESRFHFEKPLEPVPYGRAASNNFKTNTFGHKRPPARRPIGHLKLCKVCGIKH